MANVKKRIVQEGCGDCPFDTPTRDGDAFCCMDYIDAIPELSPEEELCETNSRELPEWCPLRIGPVVVMLSSHKVF